MRKVLSCVALTAFFSTMALAADFNGKLIDATCHDQKKTACDATSTTASFGLDVGGKFYRLDSAGNTKAATALKQRADRSDPSKPQSKTVMAKVKGTESGGTIQVEEIDVQ